MGSKKNERSKVVFMDRWPLKTDVPQHGLFTVYVTNIFMIVAPYTTELLCPDWGLNAQ